MAANLTKCPDDYTLTLPATPDETLAVIFPKNCRVSHIDCTSPFRISEAGTDGETMSGGLPYAANTPLERQLPPRHAAASGITLYFASSAVSPTLTLKLRPDVL